jgi:hypothetical protein
MFSVVPPRDRGVAVELAPPVVDQAVVGEGGEEGGSVARVGGREDGPHRRRQVDGHATPPLT